MRKFIVMAAALLIPVLASARSYRPAHVSVIVGGDERPQYFANGKITEIEVIGDPARLGELEVSIVD